MKTTSGSITTQNLNPASGTATAGSAVELANLTDEGAALIQITGTYTGALRVQLRADTTNWLDAPVLDVDAGTSSTSIASASEGMWRVDVSGAVAVRVSANDGAVSGTAVVVIRAGAEASLGLGNAATPSGENHIGSVGGNIANPSANFTRPADTTAYTSGDLVANSTTAGSVAAMQFTAARVAAGSFMLRRARIHKSGTSTTNAIFRLHLFRAAPTPANGDNGAFSTDGVADYIGAFDATVDRAFTDGASGSGLPVTGSDMSIELASGQIIYGLIEARGAYTPASAEVFTATLEVIQN